MQLRDVEYVCTLAEHGNFSRAAKVLYVSQPALSQAIKRLEEQLGVTLFIRRKNAVTPTRAGELFLASGQQMMALSRLIERQMLEVQGLKQGRLELGLSALICRAYLPQVLPVFRRLYPNIALDIAEMSSYDLEEQLHRRKIELAVLPLPLADKGLDHTYILTEETLLAVPKSHRINQLMPQPREGELNTVSLSLFSQDPFIVQFPYQRMRTLSDEACRMAGFEPIIAFETQMTDTVNALVSTGMGVGFIPRTTNLNPGVVYYRMSNRIMDRKIVAAYVRGQYLSHAAREFIQVFQEVAGAKQ